MDTGLSEGGVQAEEDERRKERRKWKRKDTGSLKKKLDLLIIVSFFPTETEAKPRIPAGYVPQCPCL